MLVPSTEMDHVIISGSGQDWQILWSNSETKETWVGMTEKMKEQLCWCYCYLRKFNPRAERIIPWGLERFTRHDPDQLLLYTMIDRRLRKEGEAPETYYAWRLPFYLPANEKELKLRLKPSNKLCSKLKFRIL